MAGIIKPVVSIALFLAVLSTSSTAFAHAHLKNRSPAPNAVVTSAPQAITLDFSEGIEPKFSGVKVTGPDQKVVKMAKTQVNTENPKQMIVPVEETLEPGTYQVAWQVVSVDGHKTKGNYAFTVK